MESKLLRVLMRLLLALSFVMIASCRGEGQRASINFLLEGNRTSPELSVEIANTPKMRSLGLMYRKKLGEQEGMLFIFPDEEKRSFWMKNTYVPLDMIFISSDGKVLHIVKNAVPLTETPRKCDDPAKYVLEIPGGMADKLGIVEGSTALIKGILEPSE